MISSSDGYGKLPAEDKLVRKKQFFREAVTETDEYHSASRGKRQAMQTFFFWKEVSEAALSRATALNPHRIALVTQDSWPSLEQRLVADFEKKGISLQPRLHATESFAQVYDQLAVNHPELVLVLGGSSMKDEVLEDIASSDRIYGTDLSKHLYPIEPPPAY